MSRKLGRNYILTIEYEQGKFLDIKPPFTIEFEIVRNTFSSANSGNIRIYNLNKDTRAKIRKDENDYGNLKNVSLVAGYGDDMSIIFSGQMLIAQSERIGTNYVTSITAFDGGYAYQNSILNQYFKAGTTNKAVLQSMAQSLINYGLSIGQISDAFSGSIQRGNSYSGSATEILAEITGGNFFIDNGKIYCMNQYEFIEKNQITIDATRDGILGTPKREYVTVYMEIIFEPRFFLNQRVNVTGLTDETFNTDYIVKSIAHSGTISAAVSGNLTTTVGLLSIANRTRGYF